MEETPNQNTQNISNSADETKSSKARIAIIALAVLALCGIGFGVYEFVQNNDLQSKNNELQNTIKDYELSSSLKNEDKETDADIADSANANEEVSDNYLEIPEWGIQIKIFPNTVKYVSYKFPDPNNKDFIYIWAADSTYDDMPEFADPEISVKYPLAIIQRIQSDEYVPHRFEAGGAEIGIFDSYMITYEASPLLKSNEGDSSRQQLKAILSNPDNYSKL